MKTSKNHSVLFLYNKEAVCCYCGKKLTVENKVEYDEYQKYEWKEYECDCQEWNKSIEVNERLEELNKNLYLYSLEYQRQFKEIIKANNVKVMVKMYDL